jgi:hypothetical protein
MPDHDSYLLANEFASVRVEVDSAANGPRLKLTDLSSGMHAFFDPLELQSLAWVSHADLAGILSPDYARLARRSPRDPASEHAIVAAAEDLLRQVGG